MCTQFGNRRRLGWTSSTIGRHLGRRLFLVESRGGGQLFGVTDDDRLALKRARGPHQRSITGCVIERRSVHVSWKRNRDCFSSRTLFIFHPLHGTPFYLPPSLPISPLYSSLVLTAWFPRRMRSRLFDMKAVILLVASAGLAVADILNLPQCAVCIRLSWPSLALFTAKSLFFLFFTFIYEN